MGTMRRFLILAALPLAVACGPPGIEGPDAGDDVDGSGAEGGLEFWWSAPGLDTPVGDCVVEEIELHLRDLRAVGDATPGDETYRLMQEVKLDGGDEPKTIFAAAPPGRYSAFEFQLARASDGEDSWAIKGEVTIGGEVYDLDIEDEESASISLPIDVLLGAGETRIIHVEVDVVSVVEGVDWSQATIEEGKAVVDEDSPLMDGLRSRLAVAFSVGSID